MKKQFFRVKQLVDQTVSRAEQSEVLTEDVQSAERDVELLKLTCGTISKKINALLSKSEGAQVDKRLKKIPDSSIGHTLIECGGTLSEKSILRELLTECGQVGTTLGSEMLLHEIDLEKNVIDPLNHVENEAANIAKARRNLNKLILDMDSARTRYRSAQKQATSGGSVTKVDGIKEEMEEAQLKVDIARDSLAADIYTLIAKESDFAKLVLHLVESQRNYHRAALKLLDENIPILESKLKTSVQKPVFGIDLDEHLNVTGRTIAHPIEVCVIALYETGLDEEGVFRIAGGASKVRKFRAALDANRADLGFALELHDVHIMAGILKSYLRELPDPLFSYSLYDDWINAVKINEMENRINALAEVIRKLPENRYNNIRYLVKFFHELSRHQEHNKMTPQNLAIVLAPSLLWSPAQSGDTLSMNMSLANAHAAVIEHLITFSDRFFPGEVDYYATYSRALYAGMLLPPSPLNGGFGDQVDSKEEERSHRRMGSTEGLGEPRQHTPSGYVSESSSVKVESPRPIGRKKNKPAPVPPGLGTPTLMPSPQPKGSVGPGSTQQLIKTPEKEERKSVPVEERQETRPSLPPTGPDSKRLSGLQVERKPVLAPRPTPSPLVASQTHISTTMIGNESVEPDLRRQGSLRATNKSDDDSVETRKPPSTATHKRLSSYENVIASTTNPTHHPNAVSIFGPFTPPASQDRASKVEGERQRPYVPERPSVIKLQGQGATSAVQEAHSPSEAKAQGGPAVLERVHSFSVNKQQVSIVQVNNTSQAPVALAPSDASEIQFADSEDSGHSGPPANSIEAAKPNRPPKPERLSQPSSNGVAESNNNSVKTEPQHAEDDVFPASVPPATGGTLPRPAPRSQPPVPPTKPRTSLNLAGAGGDSTDL